VDLWRSGDRMVISEVLLHSMGDFSYRNALGRLGLRMEGDGDERAVFVANQHEALERIFASTRWSGGRWATALSYLEGAGKSQPKRFAGILQRATILPYRHLPVSEEEGAQGVTERNAL
jgi:hypothetical protein